MRKMSKLMSLLMVLVMVLMLVPASAFAEEVTVGDTAPIVLTTTDITTADVDPATVVDPTPAVTEPVVVPVAVEAPAAVVEPAVVAPAVVEPVVAPAAVVEPAAVVPQTLDTQSLETQAVEEGTIETMAPASLFLWRDDVTQIDVLLNAVGADYAYDAVANALTLDGFIGRCLDVNETGSAFALILKGDNFLMNTIGTALNVTNGDLIISGNGELIAQGLERGIQVTNGDLVINSGSVEAYAYSNDADDAVAISTNIAGNLIINGGYVDAVAVNTSTNAAGGAYGIRSDEDVVVNGGDIDVYTESVAGDSFGIAALDDVVFNGGYTFVESYTDTGLARAILAYDWVVINDGILDLTAAGGVNPLAIYGEDGVYIDPCYGYVDLTASSLYLEKNCGCGHHHHCHATSTNPKTGTQDMSQDALIAIMALLALMGTAYLVSKKESQF